MTTLPDSERKTLILTGASRGIGHATAKRFSTAGWRAITVLAPSLSGELSLGCGT